MDLIVSLNAPSDQEGVIHTGSQLKIKRGLCGGMLIADGLEPPFMVL
jgi:hypothetical protein